MLALYISPNSFASNHTQIVRCIVYNENHIYMCEECIDSERRLGVRSRYAYVFQGESRFISGGGHDAHGAPPFMLKAPELRGQITPVQIR